MSRTNVDEMTVFEQARWFSLMEAVNIIATEADERNIDFNKLKISPLDLEKYIEKTCDIFAREIEREQEKKKGIIIDIVEKAENDIYSRV